VGLLPWNATIDGSPKCKCSGHFPTSFVLFCFLFFEERCCRLCVQTWRTTSTGCALSPSAASRSSWRCRSDLAQKFLVLELVAGLAVPMLLPANQT
jgi:hypothetical protein